MNFSINQVRHLFVANTVGKANTTPTTKGELAAFGVNGKYLYFQQMGAGGLVSSDKIDVAKIESASLTKSAAMNTKLKSKTVTVTEAVAGQTYDIKLIFRNYIGLGDEDMTVRLGTYTARSKDTVATIAAGLAASLKANLKHDVTLLADVSVNDAVITIKETESEWKLGKFPIAIVPFEVQLSAILNDGLYDVEWATIADGDATEVEDASKKLADLEYFAMGARADEYRGMGYPRNIGTEYLVDTSKKYDIITLHYYYSEGGLGVEHSDVDIQIAVPAGDTTLAAAINTITGAKATDKAYIPVA